MLERFRRTAQQALARMDQSQGLAAVPRPHREQNPFLEAVRPLLLKFIQEKLVPQMDPNTLQVHQQENLQRQTMEGNGAIGITTNSFGGWLQANRGIDTYIAGRMRGDKSVSMTHEQMINQGEIGLPATDASDELELNFYTRDRYNAVVQEITHRPSMRYQQAVRQGVYAPELAYRSGFNTASIRVYATPDGCTVVTWYNRRDQEGATQLKPTVERIAKQLQAAVSQKKYDANLRRVDPELFRHLRGETSKRLKGPQQPQS